ncbi:MAG TPA: TatD family hydrolase [Planctomycetota bacterium]|jgi:TatD DNase family protein|nr:TatD family hydrolase [Planctomycetota bacterium]OQC21209.1 MAG: putative deoxyribonuclease YcfH [Planctomycetes bacterium ADurb.Bin069]HNR99114.1 TatD family hydrolase [Planctomycetota bacterium]HNU25849.1 TatD family hydrolase [Planctomycetota bacterium]HOE29771.1 TatD family hydrolase [Planctomycetota bacterium]
MQYLDFHCHLDDERYDGARERIVDDCVARGFARLVTVADAHSERSLRVTEELLARSPRTACVVGAHPHKAAAYDGAVERALERFAAKAVGIGEAGLDYHYNFSPPEDQRRVFARQIAIAKEMGKPLIVHSRAAEREALALIDAGRFAGPVVFHCFTGDAGAAGEIAARGWCISVSGIVTFPKAEDLREIVRTFPAAQLFTETDAPYLAPVPFRGKLNTPAWVAYVAEAVAALRGLTVEELNARVVENFARLAAPPAA